MKKRIRISATISLIVTFYFALISLVQAEPGETIPGGKNVPIWNIIKKGTDETAEWIPHVHNPRFAIYNVGTPGDDNDDMVLDRETGLVWARNANIAKGMLTWQDAINFCRDWVQVGKRRGWRLPTIEELLSLIDMEESNPALPKGHPFINVQGVFYWSSTTYESSSARAWYISMGIGVTQVYAKTISYFVWPVRGGNGYATGKW